MISTATSTDRYISVLKETDHDTLTHGIETDDAASSMSARLQDVAQRIDQGAAVAGCVAVRSSRLRNLRPVSTNHEATQHDLLTCHGRLLVLGPQADLRSRRCITNKRAALPKSQISYLARLSTTSLSRPPVAMENLLASASLKAGRHLSAAKQLRGTVVSQNKDILHVRIARKVWNDKIKKVRPAPSRKTHSRS
jgi:hypothetical protein